MYKLVYTIVVYMSRHYVWYFSKTINFVEKLLVECPLQVKTSTPHMTLNQACRPATILSIGHTNDATTACPSVCQAIPVSFFKPEM